MVISSPLLWFFGVRGLFYVVENEYITFLSRLVYLLILALNMIWIVKPIKWYSKKKTIPIVTWLLFFFSVIFLTILWFGVRWLLKDDYSAYKGIFIWLIVLLMPSFDICWFLMVKQYLFKSMIITILTWLLFLFFGER